jgi:hypothetical protein
MQKAPLGEGAHARFAHPHIPVAGHGSQKPAATAVAQHPLMLTPTNEPGSTASSRCGIRLAARGPKLRIEKRFATGQQRIAKHARIGQHGAARRGDVLA